MVESLWLLMSIVDFDDLRNSCCPPCCHNRRLRQRRCHSLPSVDACSSTTVLLRTAAVPQRHGQPIRSVNHVGDSTEARVIGPSGAHACVSPSRAPVPCGSRVCGALPTDKCGSVPEQGDRTMLEDTSCNHDNHHRHSSMRPFYR
jgi:hypothetical protein